MKVISSYCLAKLHELAVEYVYKYGTEVITEDSKKTLESEAICLTTTTPWDYPMVSEKSALTSDFAEEYMQKLVYGYDKNVKFEYDYHSRLFAYRNIVNQIDDYIIPKLIAEPESRRAIAITWNPETDETMNDCPCLQLIQCTIRDKKLDITAVFRSNDMLLAAGQNMYALVGLQSYIAENVGVSLGKYTHISLIPHIYYVDDADELKKFVKK